MTILEKTNQLFHSLLQRVGLRKPTAAPPAIVNAVVLEKPLPADGGTEAGAAPGLSRASGSQDRPADATAAPVPGTDYGRLDRPSAGAPHPEIDFMGMGNLEETAETLSIPIETLEKWVGAGMLSPGETAVAERLIRILREKDRRRSH